MIFEKMTVEDFINELASDSPAVPSASRRSAGHWPPRLP